jgi:hypothetical protein
MATVKIKFSPFLEFVIDCHLFLLFLLLFIDIYD